MLNTYFLFSALRWRCMIFRLFTAFDVVIATFILPITIQIGFIPFASNPYIKCYVQLTGSLCCKPKRETKRKPLDVQRWCVRYPSFDYPSAFLCGSQLSLYTAILVSPTTEEFKLYHFTSFTIASSPFVKKSSNIGSTFNFVDSRAVMNFLGHSHVLMCASYLVSNILRGAWLNTVCTLSILVSY